MTEADPNRIIKWVYKKTRPSCLEHVHILDAYIGAGKHAVVMRSCTP